jgi:hypothetical protein
MMLAKITAWIPVATLIVMIVSICLTLNPQFHFVGPNAPNLKAAPPLPHNVLKPILMPAPRRPSPDSEPEDGDTPTNVSVANSGRIGALLQWVEFIPEEWVRPVGMHYTAHREVETIPIVFRMFGLPSRFSTLRYDLTVPMLIIGDDEWTVLRVSFIWPECAGKMLRGHLVAHFANAADLRVEDVVLNMLRP